MTNRPPRPVLQVLLSQDMLGISQSLRGSKEHAAPRAQSTNFHGRSCSLIFRSRVGSLVSKKIPPGSPPVLVPKPPLLPRYSL